MPSDVSIGEKSNEQKITSTDELILESIGACPSRFLLPLTVCFRSATQKSDDSDEVQKIYIQLKMNVIVIEMELIIESVCIGALFKGSLERHVT